MVRGAPMEHVDVLIVGAGISGIGAACHLRTQHPDHTFAILESRAALGGTWDLFRYPGVRSDSDMYTFGFSFRPWVDDRDIATGEAIVRYLEDTVHAYDLHRQIRFHHRVIEVRWSSSERRWVATVRRLDDGTEFPLSCRFLLTCTGYYNYARGHQPEFPGLDDYAGAVARPQHWPSDLDYAGKRVLVIGSGATAVTLVPALAKTAAHVTMLQRSPGYVLSRPSKDAMAVRLRKVLPDRWVHRLTRLKNIFLQWYGYRAARAWPEKMRALLRRRVRQGVGPGIDVDRHFTPTYAPWDQRLCLIPDGDLFESLRTGAASIVTDTIDHFHPRGVVLVSGRTIDADVVVPATGLELQFLGGMGMWVDERPIEPRELVSYRGVMFAGVPNCVSFLGYTAASWTLKVDLTAQFVCRLLRFMRAGRYESVVPRAPESRPTRPIMANLASAGYVARAGDRMPKQGTKAPWIYSDDVLRDRFLIGWSRMQDGVLKFSRGGPP